eukprot:Gb_08211 [translate_table: standard]
MCSKIRTPTNSRETYGGHSGGHMGDERDIMWAKTKHGGRHSGGHIGDDRIAAIQPSSTKLGDLRRLSFISTKPSLTYLTSVQGLPARIAVSTSCVSMILGKSHVKTNSDESSSLHVSRRTGNYHPNLWHDRLVQSLPTPAYEHEANSELARETLIKEIKDTGTNQEVLVEAGRVRLPILILQPSDFEFFDCIDTMSLQVTYALDYPWRNNLPRLEASSFIDAYAGQSTDTRSNEYRLKCLELGKLDFNMLQSSHQKEMQLVSGWWRQSGLADLTFARHRHVEYSFWAAAMAPEPGFSKFRIAFAKLSTLETMLDDMYDTYGTVDELKLFTEAVRRWDLSLMERLPEYMRICFKVLYEVVNELASEAQNIHGSEMLDYIRRAWEAFIGAHLQEAEWIADEYVPTMEEYIDDGIISFGLGLLTLHGMLLWNQPLTDHILREIDMPSRFHRLVGLTARLRGDCKGFRIEKARGEVASSVSCYMKDNPGCTEEDALKYIDAVLDDLFKGLNWELFKPDNINNDSMWNIKKHAFNIARGTQFFYTHCDGFKDSATDINDHVRKALIEPVAII